MTVDDDDREHDRAAFAAIDKAAATGAPCGCREYSAGMTVVCGEHGKALMAPYTNLAPCTICGGPTHRPHTFSRMRLCGPCDAIQMDP